MSLTDDQDFIDALVQQSAEIVGTEIGKVRQELEEERREKERLQEQVNRMQQRLEFVIASVEKMKEQNATCKCTKLVGALKQALDHAEADDTPEPPMSPIPVAQSTPVRPQPGTSGQLPLTQQQRGTKRHLPSETPVAEQTFVSKINEMDAPWQEILAPFKGSDKHVTTDKLNEAQRAFLKFKAQQSQRAGEPLSTNSVEVLLEEGQTINLWSLTGEKEDDEVFKKYVHQRMKNERRQFIRKTSLAGHAAMVSHYISKAKTQRDFASTQKDFSEDEQGV